MVASEALGWAGSGALIVTTTAQIVRQWRASTSKGVSAWLFIGEIVAAVFFAAYALLIHNRVYVFTNVVMLVAAAVGLSILAYHRHRGR